MKNKSFIAIAAIVLIASVGCAIYAYAGARRPAGTKEFKGSAAYDKLDLRLKQAWDDSVAPGGNPDRHIECMLKAAARPTEEQRAALSAAGFGYRTVVGTIVTGGLKIRALQDVAALPFVQVMELAVPLTPKH